MADDKPEYRCLLCPDEEAYVSTDRVDVRRHITRKQDSRHKDRVGDEPGVIGHDGEEDVEEPGATVGENRVRETAGNATFEGPEGGIDATMSHIAEKRNQAGDTVPSVEAEQATLIALEDEEIVDLIAAETVSMETKLSVLEQIRSHDPLQ